jgi:Zinc carboxypeptidase
MTPSILKITLYCLLACAGASVASAAETHLDLKTTAEKSNDLRTGRYDEVERLCAAFQQAWPKQVRCFDFGRTPEGRPMLALAASADGVLDAATAHARNRTVVLMQGGIHAGEIDGKDAGFLALREMLEGSTGKNVLGNATFVFVPVFNVDGHERFGRWNRPNQVGPEEMGWRVTAQNLNLNRDYVKADAPEMQAMLRLLNEWDPILYADLHVTDGAKFEHDISINVTPTLAGDAELKQVGINVRDAVLAKLTSQGSLPLGFYPSFIDDDDPQSGFADNVSTARFSQQYWATRNRIGVLVETHSWKTYATRVRITHNTILELLEQAARNGQQWTRIAHAAEQRESQLGGKSVTLAFRNTDRKTMIDFRGYQYTREPSAISGALMTRYDDEHPQIWHIPLYDEIEPALGVSAPRGGYVIPAAYSWIGDKLKLHGIEYRLISAAKAAAPVETFRATKVTLAPQTFEGRAVITVEGGWATEPRSIPEGSLFVPIAQPRAVLAMTLLEPKGPDSLVSWGFLNAAFERKEYVAAYVAEEYAAEMMKDPKIKAEFDAKLAASPEFAKSPQARLDFFYRRHNAWDDRFNLYPVYRVAADPTK